MRLHSTVTDRPALKSPSSRHTALTNVFTGGPVAEPAEEDPFLLTDQHMADTATETVDREIDYTLEEIDGRLLAAIDAGLARIEAGTYGTCVNCGAQIAPERLEAMPWPEHGTVVIVGMLAASAIAIFLIPALYVIVERIASRGKSRVPAPEAAAPAAGGPH